MTTILFSLLLAASSCYFVFFIPIALWPIEMAEYKTLIFFDKQWLPFVVFLTATFSAFKLGCHHVRDVAIANRHRCLVEVEQKEERLIQFIKLARLILKDDGEIIVKKFINDVEERYKLKEGADEQKERTSNT